jgi:hypothetical protein
MIIIKQYDFFEMDESFKEYFKSLEEKKIEEITKDEYIKLFCYIEKGERINSKRDENNSYFSFRANWFVSSFFISLSKIFFDEFIVQVIYLIDKSLKETNNKKIINLGKIHYILLRDFHNNLQEKYNKESLSKLIDYLISLDESIYRKIDSFNLKTILSFISLDSSNYSFIKNKMINDIENSNLYLEKLFLINPFKDTIKDFFDIYESVPRYMVFSKENKNYLKLKPFINPYYYVYNTKPFMWVNARKAKLYDSFMFEVSSIIENYMKYHKIDDVFDIITLEQMKILLSDYYDFFKEENKLTNENSDDMRDSFIDKIWENLTREAYINILEELISYKNYRLSNEAKIRLDGLYNSISHKKDNSYYKDILDNGLLPISSPLDLFEVVKEIWDKDIRNWIEEEGYYRNINELAKKQQNTNAEDFIQKSIEPKIESGFYKRGYKEKTFIIKREEQLLDDKRLDFTISYPPFSSIVIELKLAHNAEVKFKKNNEATKKAKEYISKLKQYIKGSKSNFALFVIFNVEEDTTQKSFNEQIDKLKELYNEEKNINIIGLNCMNGNKNEKV